MKAALLLSVLCGSLTALAQAPTPLKLGSLGLSYVDLSENKGDFFLAELDQALLRRGFQVVSKRDVMTMIGFERQKQMLGCADESNSCLAEISSALGVDQVLTGQLAKVGSVFAINLKVINATDVKTLAIYSARASSEEELLDLVSGPAAEALTRQTFAAVGREVPVATSAVVDPPSTLRAKAWIPASIGGAFLLGAGASYALASGQATAAREADSVEGFNDARESGQQLQTVAFALGGAALAGVGVAAAFYFLGGEDAPAASPSVALSSEGAAVVLSGRF